MKLKIVIFCIFVISIGIIFYIGKNPISQLYIERITGTHNSTKSSPPTSSTTKETPDPIQVSKTDTYSAVTLPLTILESSAGTGWEGGTVPTPIPVPKTIEVRLPDQYKGMFSASTIVEYNQMFPILLSLKGWTGSGSVGANGNTSYSVHQKSDLERDIPFVSYYEVPACDSCFYNKAALIFPLAMQDAKGDPIREPEPVPGLKTLEVSPTIVSYSYPITPSGLEIYGIASITIENNKAAVPFRSFEVGLPIGQRDTATVLLNYFYNTYFTQGK